MLVSKEARRAGKHTNQMNLESYCIDIYYEEENAQKLFENGLSPSSSIHSPIALQKILICTIFISFGEGSTANNHKCCTEC